MKGFGTIDARAGAQKDEIKAMADGAAAKTMTKAVTIEDEYPAPVEPEVAPTRTIFRTSLKWRVISEPNPSFLHLLMDPCIMLMCWLTVVGGVGFGVIEATLPLHLASSAFGATASIIGLVFLAMVIPNSIGAIVSGALRDRYGSKWVLYVGLAITAIVAPFLAFAGTYATICVALAFYGWFSAMVGLLFAPKFRLPLTNYIHPFLFQGVCPSLPELSILVPQSAAGRVYGLFNITFATGLIVGPLIGGAVYNFGDYPNLPNNGKLLYPMIVVAVFNAVSIPLMWVYLWLKEERDQVEAIVKWEAKHVTEVVPVAAGTGGEASDE